jgi:threonylcarbamoyladenosine tRNA methylthiotransferase MtaB
VAAGSPEPRRPAVRVLALGCRVSRADADAIAAELSGRFGLAAPGEPADFVVVNGCAVTADAEAAARQAIRRAAREHPSARIVAAGCCAEVAAGALAGLPGVAAVIGARSGAAVANVVARLSAGARPGDAVGAAARDGAAWGEGAAPARHTRPFLKVQDGCDARCSYCVVPAARGPSRSLPLEEALRRLALLGERHAEVVLTGVHLGGFGRDLAPRSSLGELVREVGRRRPVARLRLSSVEPTELPVAALAGPDARAVVCDHLHLPIQSGSAPILEAMRRPHAPDGLRRAFAAAVAAMPGACLGTDVLAGFPGETERDHRATVALVEALPLAYLHVFPFSPRPGTAAAALPGRVPGDVVRGRVRELRAISERRWRAFLAAQRGRELEVLVEAVEDGRARGRARGYAPVRFPAGGARRGDLVRVRVDGVEGAECSGTRVAPARSAG